MTLQKEFTQMPIYTHFIDKIARINGCVANGNLFNLDFLLQQFPETEFHLQPFEREKGVIFQGVYGQDIAYHQVERKAQSESPDRDVQAGRPGSNGRSLIYRKPLNRRQIKQDNCQQKQQKWRGNKPQPPTSFPRCYRDI